MTSIALLPPRRALDTCDKWKRITMVMLYKPCQPWEIDYRILS